MSLIKWEPFRDIERLFEEDFPLSRFSNKVGWDLAVDIYENKGNIVAEMNLPGIDPEKINITVEDDGFMRISGSRSEEKEDKSKNYYSKEIRRGGFERAVRLPCPVQGKKAEAEYQNGVLRVVIPPKEETKSDKVKVKIKK